VRKKLHQFQKHQSGLDTHFCTVYNSTEMRLREGEKKLQYFYPLGNALTTCVHTQKGILHLV